MDMLNDYCHRYDTNRVLSQNIATDDTSDEHEKPYNDCGIDSFGLDIRLDNTDILSNLEFKVSYLERR